MSNLKRDIEKHLTEWFRDLGVETAQIENSAIQIINLIESVADKVIGEDEPKNIKSPPRGFSNPRFDVSIPRNNLRAEQRDTKSKLIDGGEK